MDILQVAVLGGVLALDATSVGQFMTSRPLVAGALTGWVVGEPALGVTLGAVLELYLLVAFPTGGSRFPEGATATVVAVGSSVGADVVGAMPLAIAAGLVWGQLGGVSITWLRRANGRIVLEPGAHELSPGRIVRVHLGAVLLDFFRGALVTASGVLVARLAIALFAGSWPLGAPASMGLLMIGAAVSLGILLRDYGGYRKHRIMLVAGLALGIVGARFL